MITEILCLILYWIMPLWQVLFCLELCTLIYSIDIPCACSRCIEKMYSLICLGQVGLVQIYLGVIQSTAVLVWWRHRSPTCDDKLRCSTYHYHCLTTTRLWYGLMQYSNNYFNVSFYVYCCIDAIIKWFYLLKLRYYIYILSCIDV